MHQQNREHKHHYVHNILHGQVQQPGGEGRSARQKVLQTFTNKQLHPLPAHCRSAAQSASFASMAGRKLKSWQPQHYSRSCNVWYSNMQAALQLEIHNTDS
jgi:hypothetical protein